ncbi:hypothetical protein [Pseudonocardia kunmingensis]|uniref:Integral membrane protein n=1 Tax=Pseudonocardia kunmingensis TaxID=630975 RepID=A0A543E0L7_9PSEU|nr:hypothetical protein [Pseudonocardia kunmingensis]TQM15112.1 hypothetical protein FB558_1894 [Pseudonocardia kunmingensis]
MSAQDGPVAGPPRQVRLAGLLVAVQGLVGLGFAVALVVRALTAEGVGLPVGDIVGEAGYFALVGAALVAVGVGLVRGRRWARTPAIVTQLLLLPVVYTLLGPSRQLLLGIVAGVVVVATFLLLISEASRTWSMGLNLPDAPPQPR